MKEFDLNDRLIDFSVQIIAVLQDMESSKAGNHLANQLVRSGTSPSLNYSEALSAESGKDFIHKMSIVLKELRETFTCLQIITRAKLFLSEQSILRCTTNENNELIAIFVKSIQTSRLKIK